MLFLIDESWEREFNFYLKLLSLRIDSNCNEAMVGLFEGFQVIYLVLWTMYPISIEL